MHSILMHYFRGVPRRSRFHFHRPLDIGDSRMFFNAANVLPLGAAFRLDKFPEKWVACLAAVLFASGRRYLHEAIAFLR